MHAYNCIYICLSIHVMDYFEITLKEKVYANEWSKSSRTLSEKRAL